MIDIKSIILLIISYSIVWFIDSRIQKLHSNLKIFLSVIPIILLTFYQINQLIIDLTIIQDDKILDIVAKNNYEIKLFQNTLIYFSFLSLCLCFFSAYQKSKSKYLLIALVGLLILLFLFTYLLLLAL